MDTFGCITPDIAGESTDMLSATETQPLLPGNARIWGRNTSGSFRPNMPLKRDIRAKLEERLEFETLVADLSARFVNLPANRVDAEILDAQRRICECLRVDVSALWQNEVESSSTYVLTHLFRPPGGPPAPDRMDAQDYFPWCRRELLAGKDIIVSSLDKLPPEAARDKESWKYFGVKTSLTIPLAVGGGPAIGFLSFNDIQRARDWPDDLVKRLKLVAQIIASTLARKKSDETLRESEELSRSTFDQAAVGIGHIATDGRWLRVNDKLCSLLGFSREEMLQMTTHDITCAEDLEKDLSCVQELLSGAAKTFSTEKRYIRKDRSQFWAKSTVSLVQTVTEKPKYFISVVEDITGQKRAEEGLRNLSGRLITVQEQERAWVAKELHDGICQHLALLAVNLDRLKDNPPDQQHLCAHIEQLSKRTKEMAEDVRRLSHGLHPFPLEQLGLTAALNSFCRRLELGANLRIECTAHDVVRMLPKDVALCLYRVAQEALQNVMKHSGAKRATVDLTQNSDEIRMRIADDGKGFDLESIDAANSLGLAGMRERVGLVQGELSFDSHPGQGTVVDAHIPLQSGLKSLR
ncbi:MAG: PAS domain S-box protein [Terriglobia bacterium]|nr:PAS domain S-box protein [Terriglobia bacterium]